MIIGNTRYPSPALQQLVAEDAVGQLRRHEGLMATLGSENGSLKLDWVEGVARLLADHTRLEEIETEAREIWERGIRHIPSSQCESCPISTSAAAMMENTSLSTRLIVQTRQLSMRSYGKLPGQKISHFQAGRLSLTNQGNASVPTPHPHHTCPYANF